MQKFMFAVLSGLLGITATLPAQLLDSDCEANAFVTQALVDCNKEADRHLSRQEYEVALEKYREVVNYIRGHGLSDPSNLLQAICGSMFCHDLLDQSVFAKEVFDELVYEVAMLNERVESIGWFRSSQVYSKFVQNQQRYNTRIESIDFLSGTPEENCQLQCNGYAVAVACACSKVPNAAIQFLCYGCIFGLEQVCVRCCKGQGFWENCVRGLRRLFHDPEHPENPARHPYE